MEVVFPVPLMPKKAITKGLSFSLANSNRSIFSEDNISVSVCLRVSSIFFETSLGNGSSSNSTFRSSFIFSITSTETLFSSSANSSSQNNSSNFSAEIFLVGKEVLTLSKNDSAEGSAFEALEASLLCAFSSAGLSVDPSAFSSFVSVTSTVMTSVSSSFLPNNLLKNDCFSVGSSDAFFSFVIDLVSSFSSTSSSVFSFWISFFFSFFCFPLVGFCSFFDFSFTCFLSSFLDPF